MNNVKVLAFILILVVLAGLYWFTNAGNGPPATERMIVVALVGLSFLWVIGSLASSHDSLGPTLVIQKCVIESDPDDPYVLLEGRPEGLLHFFLDLLHLGRTVQLEANRARIRIRSDSLNQSRFQAIPSRNLSSTEYGYTRSLFRLIVAVGLSWSCLLNIVKPEIIGWTHNRIEKTEDPPPAKNPGPRDKSTISDDWRAATVIATGIAAVIFFIAYLLSKRLVIVLESSGGSKIGLRFQPGFVENIMIDMPTVEKIAGIINKAAGQRI